ncbi:MAG: glycosyl transferase family protein [Parcubacteria group bacterium Athens0714_26]|nr:MAG: glycosyl transferase family protein [Parcubacteria group bacterium Athens1014_26]TSD02620.1 MAG: glycosyl transferase family protein [Parcubacteria group bacterium Athens0714_26]
MIKILYIITKSDIGGAQKYVADLISNLDKNQFKAKILYGKTHLKWLSNKVHPWFLFFNDWMAIFELLKVYKNEQPHIVHLNSSKAGVLGSVAAFFYNRDKKHQLKIKIVFTAHGWVFNPTNALTPPVRWFYILLHKTSSLFHDKIICVSEYDNQLATLYKIAPSQKLIIIHNGINPDIKFLTKLAARKEIIKKLAPNDTKLEPKFPWIGSIGRLTKEKDFETLVETASLIHNSYFFLIGNGKEYKKIKNKINDLKIGNRLFVIEPSGGDFKYLKAFDIFAMSSIKEGLPYILLEAMAAELPCVVTRAGGIAEIIENHKNGLIVAQKNPGLIAKAVNILLSDKNISDELKKRAKEIILAKFHIKHMIQATESVYRNLI